MTTIEVDSTQELDAKLHDQIYSIILDKAIQVDGTVKRLLSSHGTGKVYLKGFIFRRNGKLYAVPGKAVAHQASSPGSPPSSDTGRLRASVYHSMGEDGEGIYARIGYGAGYGTYQELGTRLMAPRPALRPALYAVVG